MRPIRKTELWKTIVVVVSTALTVGLAGCDTKNVAIQSGPHPEPQPYITMPETNLTGEQTSIWTVTWNDVEKFYGGPLRAPYTVAWDFSGGAQNIEAAVATSPATAEATWFDSPQETSYIVTVFVATADGWVGSASSQITIQPTQIPQPVIDSMDIDGNVLTVTQSNAHSYPVEISVSGFTGMTVDESTKLADADGIAVFTFEAIDMLAGANSTVDVTTDDGHGGVATGTSGAIVIDPMIGGVDTLYALPMANSVAVDEPITILIYTGATGAFQFMLNVGVVIDGGGTYVPNSFNYGAVGGANDDADGVWADITTDAAFIPQPDTIFMPGSDPEGTLPEGSVRYDFGISPLGGTDQASVSGALFNFQVTYSSAGEKQIGFQEFNGVNRTYYTDLASGEDHFWGAYVGATIDVS